VPRSRNSAFIHNPELRPQAAPNRTAPSDPRDWLCRAGITRSGGSSFLLLEADHMITRLARRLRSDVGMTTAEYAVGTVAAVAFAVVLYNVVRSSAVQSALGSIISAALHAL
jgi:Protein of unknown function (DUF4244)